jgi:hypothetical protein
MAAGDRVYTITFTTYRLRRTIFWQPLSSGRVMPLLPLQLLVPGTSQFEGVAFTFGRHFSNAQGPKPTDAKTGYLVFEIMDDKKSHPRAWIGVPSVGPFKNLDRASSLATHFEWFDQGRRTWYTVPLQRVSLLRKPMVKYIRERAIDKILSGWRLAMTLIQALEGIVYQEPFDGFAKEFVIRQVDILQTDHLNQRYRWVSRPNKAFPAPVLATWEDNYNLMHRLFDTPLTHVGPPEPLKLSSHVVNRAMGDLRGEKMGFKYDTYNYIAAFITCTRDESRTDCWVCKCCSLLNRLCSFTAWNEAAVVVDDGEMGE